MLVGFDFYTKASGFHAQYLCYACCLSTVWVKITIIFIYRIDSQLGKKAYGVFHRKLFQNFLLKARIFASVSVRLYLGIGKIAFTVSSGTDFFAWLFILLQYSYGSPVLDSCNGSHQPGGSASYYDNTFFIHNFHGNFTKF